MLYFPPVPALPDSQRATGKSYLRYEDVCQDGRVNLLGLTPALGHVVWRALLENNPLVRLERSDGIIALLSRLVLLGDEGTVPVGPPLAARGSYQLAHTRNESGEVNRLILNLWAELDGIEGRTYGPPTSGDSVRVPVGKVFAEHVFTRPFGPPERRKVLRFDQPELPAVPEVEYSWRPWSEVLALPDGAVAHADAPSPAERVAFGLYQTDSNQHINSMVYPRLFEQAALERLADLGHSTVVLSRYCEIAYRKPAFAGDHLTIVLRTYELGDRVGAVGAFLEIDDATSPERIAAARPRCTIHLQLSR